MLWVNEQLKISLFRTLFSMDTANPARLLGGLLGGAIYTTWFKPGYHLVD